MLIDDYNPFDGKQLQILDVQGNCNEQLKPELSDSEIKKLYSDMLFVKMADNKALNLQRQGRMGTYASIRGQEACQIGSCFALKKDDWVVPAFREIGAVYMMNFGVKNLFTFWMGNEVGSAAPEGVNFLPVSIPIATHLLHAVGLAWAAKLRGTKQVSLVFFGDGGTSEGDFHEALNFAGVFKTPTIFFCQNNQYAISLPREKQTAAKTIAQKAYAYGFKGIQVDGNDVFAVYAATKEAVEHARMGYGPTLIEAYTYRLGDHTTADDAKIYREQSEVDEWAKKDPLIRLQKYMQSQGIWTKDWEDDLVADFTKKVEKITEEAEAVPAPKPTDMFDYTFATLTPQLKEQRDYLEKIMKEGDE